MDQIKTGKFIQSLRKGKGLTQNELASKLGITDRAISKWENGRGMPDYEYIQDLCKELGITFSELMAGERIGSEDAETKLEENLVSVYRDARKSNRQLSKIKIILLVIVSVVMILGGMFAIDVHQMRNNKPVVFSTWGFDYFPPEDMHELELEKAIKDFIYEKQQVQIERRQLVNAKGFVELNTFLIEENNDQSEYTVSCWVLERTYSEKDGEISEETGSSIAHEFVISRSPDDVYKVESYQIPKDGDRYEDSLKEIFTTSVRRQIKDFDMSNGIKKLIFRMEEAKDNYYGLN